MDREPNDSLGHRAAVHAALGEPIRLAIVDELVACDRSPRELGEPLEISASLLAHHIDVLADAGLVVRGRSHADRRRRYMRLTEAARAFARPVDVDVNRPVVFLCTHNSARSQLAAAIWTRRVGGPASSAGTAPARRVHPEAVAAGQRAGLDLSDCRPRMIERLDTASRVVTVCDSVHEALPIRDDWWHWSIADPIVAETPEAFDAVVDQIHDRIDHLIGGAS
jgi:protein-tyrosine-phosphatase